MSSYKILNNQCFSSGEYAIVPIRIKDRYAIMKWRNEQMYHLRQHEPLTKDNQDFYFNTVIAKLFEQEKPNQILFSYLKGDKCIGYGGLVHINWIDKNAEISFIMDTSLEKQTFEFHWIKFSELIEQVAFRKLHLHKVFTYAFNIRSYLYPILEKAGFKLEAELKEHCLFENEFISVMIHAKFNDTKLRYARKSDIKSTMNWVNNPKVRAFSYNQKKISQKEHTDWFYSKLDSTNCEYYILEVNGKPAGSIRFDIEKSESAKINYLIDPNYTGKGLGTYILEDGIRFLYKNIPSIKTAYGYVLKENIASIKIFEKLSYKKISDNGSELKYEKPIK